MIKTIFELRKQTGLRNSYNRKSHQNNFFKDSIQFVAGRFGSWIVIL